MHNFLHALSLHVIVQCITVMNIISASSKEPGGKHSTQRYGRAVHNCKIILQRVKQRSRTQSVLHQRISRLQKCKAVHWNSGIKHTRFGHVAWPRAQLLGQSVSLKFSLETRLESESFEPLIYFLAFLVQKLWSKINKLINYLISQIFLLTYIIIFEPETPAGHPKYQKTRIVA